MKKFARTLAFFLFLMIHIVPSNNFFVAEVQGQSAPPRLEGTQYEGAVILLPYNTTLHTEYIFEKQGKVTCRLTTIRQPETRPQFNIVTQRYEYVFVPANYASVDEIGTYKVTGRIIRLEFADRYIEATAKVSGSLSGLEGTVTFKKSNEKEEWVVLKTSRPDASSHSSSEVPEATQPITEADRKKKAEDSYRSYLEGEKLYEQKKYDEAIAKFDEAINYLPNAIVVYFRRGKAKVMLQDYQGAIDDLDKWIHNGKGKRTLEESYQWRGNAKLAMRDYKGALLDYDQYFLLYDKPDDESGVAVGGANLDLLGRFVDASRVQGEVYKNRGIAKYKLGDKVSACKDFRKSCKLGNDIACENFKLICE